jgi:putative transcriptional regulator
MKMNLKTARYNKGLTQSEAAKLLGISKDSLGNWERGKTFPSVPQIKQIEIVYGIKYDDIIFLPTNDALSVITIEKTKDNAEEREEV